VRAALRIVGSAEGDALRAHLNALIARLRDGLAPGADAGIDAVGWSLMPSATPVQPLVIGDNAAALGVMAALQEAGLWVPAIRPPTVPVGTARLRIALSAAHRADEVDALVGALRRTACGQHAG
jgi:8-amino-7-oxononanoate synthase